MENMIIITYVNLALLVYEMIKTIDVQKTSVH